MRHDWFGTEYISIRRAGGFAVEVEDRRHYLL
jgi:hypothetical protein